MKLRPATAADLPFLIEMLLEACNWDGTPWYDEEKARADNHAWRYLDGWPRESDFGVVAELDGSPAGATWARQLFADRPGYGYVGGVSGGLGFGLRDFWKLHPTRLDIRNAATDVANEVEGS